MSFLTHLNITADQTEKHIQNLLHQNKSMGAEKLDQAIAYSLLGGGKRLRAYMVLEFCNLCGVNPDVALDYAAAIEMIHAFSLIHDDLPAMDNDDMRRGKPSNHKAFGEATAILAGDALALDAFRFAGSNKNCDDTQNAEAMMILSKKSGALGMCAGQQCDIDGEGKKIPLAELTKLVDLKTGALFSCACVLGCIAAKADKRKKDAAEKFGIFTGRAFQITDDLLDIHSTAEELGKTIGKDVECEKSTFPALMGEDGAKRHAEECIFEAKKCLDCFDDSEAKTRLTEFCEYILIRRK